MGLGIRRGIHECGMELPSAGDRERKASITSGRVGLGRIQVVKLEGISVAPFLCRVYQSRRIAAAEVKKLEGAMEDSVSARTPFK